MGLEIEELYTIYTYIHTPNTHAPTGRGDCRGGYSPGLGPCRRGVGNQDRKEWKGIELSTLRKRKGGAKETLAILNLS